MKKSEIVGVRVSAEDLERIDELIVSGDFGSRSEFARYAIRKMLKSYEGRSPRLKNTLEEDEKQEYRNQQELPDHFLSSAELMRSMKLTSSAKSSAAYSLSSP